MDISFMTSSGKVLTIDLSDRDYRGLSEEAKTFLSPYDSEESHLTVGHSFIHGREHRFFHMMIGGAEASEAVRDELLGMHCRTSEGKRELHNILLTEPVSKGASTESFWERLYAGEAFPDPALGTLPPPATAVEGPHLSPLQRLEEISVGPVR